jgi:hypothetical protein
MKKLFMLATAAFLFTGAAFAHDGKDCKEKSCCKKDATAKKECCKKGEKAKVKETKTAPKPAVVRA